MSALICSHCGEDRRGTIPCCEGARACDAEELRAYKEEQNDKRSVLRKLGLPVSEIPSWGFEGEWEVMPSEEELWAFLRRRAEARAAFTP